LGFAVKKTHPDGILHAGDILTILYLVHIGAENG
jgi:hypothetical protein